MKFPFTLTTVFALLLPAAIAIPTTTPISITLKNFTRTFPDDKTGVYKFVIDYGFGIQACTVTDRAAGAASHSWYGVFCEENHTWEVSWGWDYKGDFTVLTVVDEPNQYEAFFGYKSPNGATSFIDQGPNTVQHT
ncbi:hypothetical protein LOCC1_G006935 [Lachnellula occidentalis]|uniref:AA1-like domain-containing protein n=1 Tax=Lachnellula occidentalis TaxID=215460 RepID=A0A8H8U9Z1_9HELO|nr:hypothetical protein LOCC1_G006935 [Lachnellula occidentalis]